MAEKTTKQKYDIATLIEREMINDIVKKASAKLEQDGGNPRNAVMLVQFAGGGKIGVGVALHGDQDLSEPVEQAVNKLVLDGFKEDDANVICSVTLIDGARVGYACLEDEFGLENYTNEPED